MGGVRTAFKQILNKAKNRLTQIKTEIKTITKSKLKPQLKIKFIGQSLVSPLGDLILGIKFKLSPIFKKIILFFDSLYLGWLIRLPFGIHRLIVGIFKWILHNTCYNKFEHRMVLFSLAYAFLMLGISCFVEGFIFTTFNINYWILKYFFLGGFALLLFLLAEYLLRSVVKAIIGFTITIKLYFESKKPGYVPPPPPEPDYLAESIRTQYRSIRSYEEFKKRAPKYWWLGISIRPFIVVFLIFCVSYLVMKLMILFGVQGPQISWAKPGSRTDPEDLIMAFAHSLFVMYCTSQVVYFAFVNFKNRMILLRRTIYRFFNNLPKL